MNMLLCAAAYVAQSSLKTLARGVGCLKTVASPVLRVR